MQNNTSNLLYNFHPPLDPDILDPGIRKEVCILFSNGIETFESCQSGVGHCFPEPTVRFHGGQSEGFKALAVAHQHGLKPHAIRRYWTIRDGEPHGPEWEMTFSSLELDRVNEDKNISLRYWGGNIDDIK